MDEKYDTERRIDLFDILLSVYDRLPEETMKEVLRFAVWKVCVEAIGENGIDETKVRERIEIEIRKWIKK